MREQYPFFRDGDEQTQAVIGEEAVSADLDGDYQKPYAVLTQKRLYCKNEQGNFITDASALQSASKGLLPGQNWFLGAVTACVGLTLVLLCLWYWGLGGRGRTENISYDAQQYIDNYRGLLLYSKCVPGGGIKAVYRASTAYAGRWGRWRITPAFCSLGRSAPLSSPRRPSPSKGTITAMTYISGARCLGL